MRRVRIACATKVADGVDRIGERASQLATTLSPRRAFENGKAVLRAKVADARTVTGRIASGSARFGGT